MSVKTFSVGETLTAADTNTFLANAGLVYVAGGSLSSTSTNFAGCFTSTYDDYRIVISGVDTTVGWLGFRMLNGTTPVNTGVYYGALQGRTSGGATAGDSGAAFTYGFLGYQYQSISGGSMACSYDIYRPNFAARTFTHGGYSTLNSAGGTYNFYDGGVAMDTAVAYDGIQIMHSTGATISGRVRIYGYRQA